MRLALLQLNLVVGDLNGNVDALAAAYDDAVADGADLVVATELAVTGYPPEDLVRKPAFVAATQQATAELAARTGAVPLVAGTVVDLAGHDEAAQPVAVAPDQMPIGNGAVVLRGGVVEATYLKQRLPNFGVFDEARYFRSGGEPVVVDVAGTGVGVTICEDMWGPDGPVAAAVDAGAQLVMNLNASPYRARAAAEREGWASHHARTHGIAVAYANQVGGQDEVVFDGASFVADADGQVRARGPAFAAGLLRVEADERGGVRGLDEPPARLEPLAETWAALVLGTRDYVRKNGFPGVLVGVSGGIDSAVTAAVATDAVGADDVTTVAMPAPVSSPASLADARQLATNLGTEFWELPIEGPLKAFEEVLAAPWEGYDAGTAHENLQSRIRGTLLMSLSNARGDLLLTTGNKSEYAVGYATLYGDMAGGFAVLKDVPKLTVYELARHRNTVAGREVVPASTIEKPPSAELRPGQADVDSLPPYEQLDPILEAYVEHDRTADDIIADGFAPDVVRRVLRLVDRAEFKRRQSAPGIKITRRAFGKDRRLPITQRWSG